MLLQVKANEDTKEIQHSSLDVIARHTYNLRANSRRAQTDTIEGNRLTDRVTFSFFNKFKKGIQKHTNSVTKELEKAGQTASKAVADQTSKTVNGMDKIADSMKSLTKEIGNGAGQAAGQIADKTGQVNKALDGIDKTANSMKSPTKEIGNGAGQAAGQIADKTVQASKASDGRAHSMKSEFDGGL